MAHISHPKLNNCAKLKLLKIQDGGRPPIMTQLCMVVLIWPPDHRPNLLITQASEDGDSK